AAAPRDGWRRARTQAAARRRNGARTPRGTSTWPRDDPSRRWETSTATVAATSSSAPSPARGVSSAGTGVREVPFGAAPDWDTPKRSSRGAPALGDLDGDDRLDLVVTDGQARSRFYRKTDKGWDETRGGAGGDPGSGLGGPALTAGE